MSSRVSAIKANFSSSVFRKKSTTGSATAWYLHRHWPYVIFAVCIACVFGQTIGYSFSPMDDRWLILARQSFLSDAGNFPALFSEPTLEHFYRPVLNATFMLDTLIGSGSEKVYHFTNILLHVFCCCLLFDFFLLLNVERPAAFWCTLLFALHPINVQAVTWIPGRNDTLLFLFVIGAAITLIRYITSGNALWLLLHFFCFAGALFTKETALLAPLVFTALLYMHRDRFRVSRIVTLISAWLSFCIAFFCVHRSITSAASVSDVNTGPHLVQFTQDLLMQLGKMIFPVQQSVAPTASNISYTSIVFVLVLTVLFLWKWGIKNRGVILPSLAFCFAFLFLPTWFGSGENPPVQHEHRVYLPLAGLLLLLSQTRLRVSYFRPAVILLPLVIVFGFMSLRRHAVYRDAFVYASTATLEAPDISMYHDIAGFQLYRQNQFEAAILFFNEAIRLDSTKPEYYNHRGNTWNSLHHYRNAIYNYNKVLKMLPAQKETYVSRSMAYYSVKEYDAALADLRSADSLGAVISPEFAHALAKALQNQEALAGN